MWIHISLRVTSNFQLYFNLQPAGGDSISGQSKLLTLSNQYGQVINYSTTGFLSSDSTNAIAPGKYFWACRVDWHGPGQLRHPSQWNRLLCRSARCAFAFCRLQQAASQLLGILLGQLLPNQWHTLCSRHARRALRHLRCGCDATVADQYSRACI